MEMQALPSIIDNAFNSLCTTAVDSFASELTCLSVRINSHLAEQITPF